MNLNHIRYFWIWLEVNEPLRSRKCERENKIEDVGRNRWTIIMEQLRVHMIYYARENKSSAEVAAKMQRQGQLQGEQRTRHWKWLEESETNAGE